MLTNSKAAFLTNEIVDRIKENYYISNDDSIVNWAEEVLSYFHRHSRIEGMKYFGTTFDQIYETLFRDMNVPNEIAQNVLHICQAYFKIYSCKI